MADKPSNEELIASLGDKLLEQLNASIEKRDVDLAERLSKQIQEEIEKATAKPTHKVPDGQFDEKDVKSFSMAKFIRDIEKKKNDHSYSSHELDMSKSAGETVGKDMATFTDSGGGFIVPTQVFSDQIIPLLQASVTAFGDNGVTRLDGLSGSPVEIPRVASGSTAYWISPEDATVTLSDLAFGQIEMRPHCLASRSRYSNRLAALSAPAAEGLIRQQISTDLGLALDLAIYNGTGASGQPVGILQQSGINTYGSTIDPDVVTGAYDDFVGVEHMLYEDNAMNLGTARWTMHPNVWRDVKRMKDSNDGTVNTAQLGRRMVDAMSQPSTNFLGYPFVITTQMPQTNILFGIMNQCLVGQWGTMIVNVVDTYLEGTFQKQILVGMEVDVAVRHPEAFVDVPVS